jgi:hypothetical protein
VLVGEMLRIENRGEKAAELIEEQIAPQGALAVSIVQPRLAPQEATTVFVVEAVGVRSHEALWQKRGENAAADPAAQGGAGLPTIRIWRATARPKSIRRSRSMPRLGSWRRAACIMSSARARRKGQGRQAPADQDPDLDRRYGRARSFGKGMDGPLARPDRQPRASRSRALKARPAGSISCKSRSKRSRRKIPASSRMARRCCRPIRPRTAISRPSSTSQSSAAAHGKCRSQPVLWCRRSATYQRAPGSPLAAPNPQQAGAAGANGAAIPGGSAVSPAGAMRSR